ncbi:hypothetical protein R1flu_013015 [Riccia fluitans]|uniref:Uncharacterized protein n=1 Tax=Riccia fluitans TaxID=41844 RepID=A0ABD1ZCJ3_9MARC
MRSGDYDYFGGQEGGKRVESVQAQLDVSVSSLAGFLLAWVGSPSPIVAIISSCCRLARLSLIHYVARVLSSFVLAPRSTLAGGCDVEYPCSQQVLPCWGSASAVLWVRIVFSPVRSDCGCPLMCLAYRWFLCSRIRRRPSQWGGANRPRSVPSPTSMLPSPSASQLPARPVNPSWPFLKVVSKQPPIQPR